MLFSYYSFHDFFFLLGTFFSVEGEGEEVGAEIFREHARLLFGQVYFRGRNAHALAHSYNLSKFGNLSQDLDIL